MAAEKRRKCCGERERVGQRGEADLRAEPLVSGAESTTSLAMLSSGLERSDKKEDKTKRRLKPPLLFKKLLD